MSERIKPVTLWLPALLSAAPFIFLVYVVCHNYVDVPFRDDWWYHVPLLEKSYQGTLSFQDFWVQFQEHRPVFPRMIFLALARLTHWDYRVELAATLLLALGSFLILASWVRKLSLDLEDPNILWLLPIISLTTFSIRKYLIWFMGEAQCGVLSILAALAGLALLSGRPFRWRLFLGAFVLGVISQYSFSWGFMFWPAAFFLLGFSRYGMEKDRARTLIFWCLAALFAVSVYFIGWKRQSVNTLLVDPLYVFKHARKLVTYFFIHLGSLLAMKTKPGFLAGGAGFFGFAGLFAFLFRRAEIYRGQVVRFAALGIFSVGNAVLVTFSRVSFPLEQAMGSTYMGYSFLFWVSIVSLLAIACKIAPPARRKIMLAACFLLWISIGGAAASASLQNAAQMPGWKKWRSEAREELFTLKNDELLSRLFENVGQLKQRVEVLRKYRLSVFRNLPPEGITPATVLPNPVSSQTLKENRP